MTPVLEYCLLVVVTVHSVVCGVCVPMLLALLGVFADVQVICECILALPVDLHAWCLCLGGWS